MMERAGRQRKGRPLFMVDIAVPRDLDPALNDLEGVFLYDIDDLEGIVEANLQERRETAEKSSCLLKRQLLSLSSGLIRSASCRSFRRCVKGAVHPVRYDAEH